MKTNMTSMVVLAIVCTAGYSAQEIDNERTNNVVIPKIIKEAPRTSTFLASTPAIWVFSDEGAGDLIAASNVSGEQGDPVFIQSTEQEMPIAPDNEIARISGL